MGLRHPIVCPVIDILLHIPLYRYTLKIVLSNTILTNTILTILFSTHTCIEVYVGVYTSECHELKVYVGVYICIEVYVGVYLLHENTIFNVYL